MCTICTEVLSLNLIMQQPGQKRNVERTPQRLLLAISAFPRIDMGIGSSILDVILSLLGLLAVAAMMTIKHNLPGF